MPVSRLWSEHQGINQRAETVCMAVRAALMHCQPEPGQGLNASCRS
jgi:hypothetical protein